MGPQRAKAGTCFNRVRILAQKAVKSGTICNTTMLKRLYISPSMQSSVGSDSDRTVLYDAGHHVSIISVTATLMTLSESLSISKVGETMHKWDG